MTLKELSQLYYLDKEIELDRERLVELRANLLCPRSPDYDGMPRNPNPENALERCVAEIVDLEDVIRAKIEQRIYERARLERYISDIPDSLTRQIFTLRFIEGLTWEDVAAKAGGNNTAKNCSNICYRYIRQS
jgi:hypothetical protein